MERANSPSETDAAWEQLAPLLEDAMQHLNESDRLAILLRFFQRQPLRQVGLALGVDEDTARKRVNRSVEKLRDWFEAKGIVCPALLIAAALTEQAVRAAPTGIAAALANSALSAAAETTRNTLLTETFNSLQTMATTKTKITAIAIAAALSIPIATQWQTNRALRHEVASLQRAATTQAGLPQTALDAATELDDLQKDRAELIRLRGEAAAARTLRTDYDQLRTANDRLRGENLHWKKIAADKTPENGSLLYIPNPYWRKSDWTNRGTGTARDALQTFLWTLANADEAALSNLVHPKVESARRPVLPRFEQIEGIQIVTQTGDQEGTYADFSVIVESWFPIPESPPILDQNIYRYHLEKADGEWRVRSLHRY